MTVGALPADAGFDQVWETLAVPDCGAPAADWLRGEGKSRAHLPDRADGRGKEANVRFELNAFPGVEVSVQPFETGSATGTSDLAQVCGSLAEEAALRQVTMVLSCLKGQPVSGMRTMKSDCGVVGSGAFKTIAVES